MKTNWFVICLIPTLGSVLGSARAQLAPPPDPPVLADGIHRADLLNVRLRDGSALRLRNGHIMDLRFGPPRSPSPVLDDLARDGFAWERAFSELSEERLEQLRRSAAATLQRPAPDLNLYYVLRVPAGREVLEVRETLKALDFIDSVTLEPLPPPPPIPPDFTAEQIYRNPAPTGIGIPSVESLPGGTGEGVAFADIEYSWNVEHEDLPSVTVLGHPPFNPFFDDNHGTAVLGQIIARKNEFGTTGLAPLATAYFSPVYPYFNQYSVSNAILRATDALPIGSIILIEQQMGGPSQFGGSTVLPVEWDRRNYDAILIAVGNGHIVVEAAGNGSANLDAAVYSTGNDGHWPFLPQNDSGAIMVGAGARYSTPRSRLYFSNYGSTLDLQGMGEGVCTTGYGGLWGIDGPNFYYTSTFNGTSSASPIVAAACILVQAHAQSAYGAVLSPREIRNLLVATGTPQANPSQRIGPYPDLAAAFAAMTPSAPGPFSLLSPAAGATNVSLLPDFAWDESWLSGHYHLVVDDDMDFSSPVINVSGLINPSYTGISEALQIDTTYYWTVKAANALDVTPSTPTIGTFTTTLTLPPPPADFALTSPLDGQTNVAGSSTFIWTTAAGASHYRIRIDDDPDFSSPAVEVSNLTASSYTNTEPLAAFTTYYWTVDALNPFGVTTAAPFASSFTTACVQTGDWPQAFSLISPPDGPNISTTTPTLTWSSSASADSYTLLVNTAPTMQNPLYTLSGITQTTYQLPAGVLSDGQRYYWQVRAVNSACATTSSPSVFTFGVVLPFCTGDADRNLTVDFDDVNAVLQHWGASGPLGDADNNGLVNFLDVQIVLSHWLRICPR